MTSDPIADRYASALFELVKREGDVEPAWVQLQEVGRLLQHHAELRRFLLNPDVESSDKLRVLDRLVAGDWSASLQIFLRLVLDMGRAESLGAIVEAFRELVDQEQRRVRVLLRSARPLAASLKATVKQRLERLDRRRVELSEETDPALIGGIQILFDRRIVDGSLQTRLAELRQQLKRVKVS